MARRYERAAFVKLAIYDGTRVRGKRLGSKKPFIETLNVPEDCRRLSKIVRRKRTIDRQANCYSERVEDWGSGEVMHECEEPLTDHTGHGSAKEPGNARDLQKQGIKSECRKHEDEA